MVYKYFSPNEHNFDALQNGYFWFSKRKYLNDPFDMAGGVVNEFPNFVKYLKERGLDVDGYDVLLDKYAVCCFSERWNNNQMWGTYADSYKGWCLEFDDSLELLDQGYCIDKNLYPVQYLVKFPDLDNTETVLRDFKAELDKTDDVEIALSELKSFDDKKLDALFRYLLLVKQIKWAYEEEKRIIIGKQGLLGCCVNDTGCRIQWNKKSFKSVTIGHNIDEKYEELVKEMARQHGVTVYKTKVGRVIDFSLKRELIS